MHCSPLTIRTMSRRWISLSTLSALPIRWTFTARPSCPAASGQTGLLWCWTTSQAISSLQRPATGSSRSRWELRNPRKVGSFSLRCGERERRISITIWMFSTRRWISHTIISAINIPLSDRCCDQHPLEIQFWHQTRVSSLPSILFIRLRLFPAQRVWGRHLHWQPQEKLAPPAVPFSCNNVQRQQGSLLTFGRHHPVSLQVWAEGSSTPDRSHWSGESGSRHYPHNWGS